MVLLKNTEISAEKWNRINTRLIYQRFEYLNAVSPEWEALVWMCDGHYLATLPIPVIKKWGIKVVSQAYFCQQLVFAGVENLKPEQISDTFKFLKQQYTLCNRYFLYANFKTHNAAPKLLENHVFKIEEDFTSKWRSDRIDNLKRAQNFNWQIYTSPHFIDLVNMHRKYQEKKANLGRNIRFKAYIPYIKWIDILIKHEIATLYFAQKENVSHAGVLVVHFNHRIIYLFNAATPLGRKYHGRLAILHKIFKENIGKTFDFEDPTAAPEVSQYYASFGGSSESYYSFQWKSPFFKVVIALKRLFNR